MMDSLDMELQKEIVELVAEQKHLLVLLKDARVILLKWVNINMLNDPDLERFLALCDEMLKVQESKPEIAPH